ncbi:MAG: LamG-like jellyroll fold domain-containing protein [Candidatus Paceibacterota bacterium]|jgi:prepilin-type N-terminal cleavage/methylation domain-containing protein
MRSANSRQLQKAFTLIELLVVIAIIGILAGMVTVNMSGATGSATIAKAKMFSGSIRSSLLADRVSEWNFDENQGIAAADIVGGNNGTLVNGPTWRTGANCVSESCLEFDGNNDYVTCGNNSSLDLFQNFTIEAWVYPMQDKSSYVFSKTDYADPGGYSIYWSGPSNTVIFYYGGSAGAVSSAVFTEVNIWVHVVIVSRNNVLTFYKNGTAAGTASASVATDNFNFVIGNRPGSEGAAGNTFNGRIDGVRLYNQALAAFQIKDSYALGVKKLFSKGSISKENYYQRLADLNLGYEISK